MVNLFKKKHRGILSNSGKALICGQIKEPLPN